MLPTTDEAWSGDPGEAMQLFLDEARAGFDVLVDGPAPDAVLYDIGGLGARIAAHRWGVPAIQLSPAMVAWDGYREETAEFTAQLKASASGARYFASLGAWLREHGVTLDVDDYLGLPPACVALLPRVLQPHADRVGPHVVFAGPCVDEGRRTGFVPPAGDRPLAYVALGTSYTDRPDLYRAAVDGLADAYRVVLATGKVDPATLGPLPDGVVAARAQPQLDVLDHAAVFVTHAGMGSASEALWAGVPTVALPQAVDQFTNAEQLACAGAGVVLAEDAVTPAGGAGGGRRGRGARPAGPDAARGGALRGRGRRLRGRGRAARRRRPRRLTLAGRGGGRYPQLTFPGPSHGRRCGTTWGRRPPVARDPLPASPTDGAPCPLAAPPPWPP
ncbi:nucleotide disphospho-sugar-binding domain-containing protein [Conexibacter sp. W3-3-2]|uniref:nucleotide disphospho-sugar-binding domain-containing protein n=1 Tax=Conexibacter sp. W3-3-2 TaxID=2675227 RepID=UPI0028151E1E|nr:nucleotide disphospho-sugar-binding domain-containing protein [Conexibacter sp. W3-3-2]